MPPDRVLLGRFGRPHGVRGLLRVQSFTADPADIAAYGPLADETGTRTFRLRVVQPGAMPVVAVEGVADREAAARLTGTALYVPRDRLPPPGEEEFYHADLIGLAVEDGAGRRLGTVASVNDHGAGAFLEIDMATAGRGAQPLLVPFTRAAVPVVDLAARRLVVAPPAEVIVPPAADQPEGAAA
ncbi:ribosome maturation factor RimM [Elioraea sp.]|jgi:16S rRNA processing protein RimM|uniref:ribosome maturation factor RimM n=1 Tax=Elioraea sp. TaxID=2185103 RepID=UPI00307F8C70